MISEFEAKVRKIIEGLNGEAEIDTENVIDGVIDALLDAIIADRSETLRQLGHETEADALDILAGAIIDLERTDADKVCIATIKRVQAQIAAVVKQATLAAVAALLIFSSPFTISTARAETVAGSARVIDGDTVDLDSIRIRLHGIDAPEAALRCTDSAGRLYPCGLDAGQALRQRIGSQAATCIRRDTDRYGRMVAVCTVGAPAASGIVAALDLGQWLVQQGHAIAYRKYGLDYVADEDATRLARLGVWEGTFQDPSAFRHQARGERQVTARAVSAIAQRTATASGAAAASAPRQGAAWPPADLTSPAARPGRCQQLRRRVGVHQHPPGRQRGAMGHPDAAAR